MASNGTNILPASNTSPSWSKEAIFALATMFIMLMLSSIGLICKHQRRSIFQSFRWLNAIPHDEELAVIRQSPHSSGWVDILRVRQYQQESYTSILRMRRGPRTPPGLCQTRGRRT
ncbi:uncharacterized protein K460DRAFT_308170 [Cucurbitaria berberidis CBS 394.84]|uniref:Uncharacterized protein n=1 Tax=Cucurbitaria berberidis CBS 394.84 TaxID=1168544 RepID=A0A9P4LBH4_9PLEO|nr:uncharacterized protein K460DRAFT_308170 [Cucurbitaria berberidis CBS 394.84]KAF1848194.1 hypothetical protein K460DRAFT_308170 [Cucurbitaria berberidis CBS 394.84]